MRAALAILCASTVAFADAAVPVGGADALRPFVSGEKQGMAIVASAAAADAIGRAKIPREPWLPLELPPGIAGIRYRRVLLLGTAGEVAHAAAYLKANGARRFRGRRFRMIGDMIYKNAGPNARRRIDADSRGRSLDTGDPDEKSGGLLYSCWDCVADEMLAAIAAMGE